MQARDPPHPRKPWPGRRPCKKTTCTVQRAPAHTLPRAGLQTHHASGRGTGVSTPSRKASSPPTTSQNTGGVPPGAHMLQNCSLESAGSRPRHQSAQKVPAPSRRTSCLARIQSRCTLATTASTAINAACRGAGKGHTLPVSCAWLRTRQMAPKVATRSRVHIT